MAELSDPEGGRHFIPRLELPERLELLRPGELIEQAADLEQEVLAALSPTGQLAGQASQEAGAGVNDVGSLAAFSEGFFSGGPAPGLDGEVNGFLSSLGEGELLAAASGLMPDVLTVEGEPPNFWDPNATPDPSELPERPYYEDPSDRPGPRPPKEQADVAGPPHPEVVAFGPGETAEFTEGHEGETAGERERRKQREGR